MSWNSNSGIMLNKKSQMDVLKLPMNEITEKSHENISAYDLEDIEDDYIRRGHTKNT